MYIHRHAAACEHSLPDCSRSVRASLHSRRSHQVLVGVGLGALIELHLHRHGQPRPPCDLLLRRLLAPALYAGRRLWRLRHFPRDDGLLSRRLPRCGRRASCISSSSSPPAPIVLSLFLLSCSRPSVAFAAGAAVVAASPAAAPADADADADAGAGADATPTSSIWQTL